MSEVNPELEIDSALENASSTIEQARTELNQVEATLQPIQRPSLTKEERRSMIRSRHGGKRVMPELVSLALTRPRLAPEGVNAATIKAKLEAAAAYRTFVEELEALTQRSLDTLQQMEAEAYKLGLDLYAIARRSSDPAVLRVVDKMKQALKHGQPPPQAEPVRVPRSHSELGED